MGQTLRKVVPGDPLSIPAASYNAFVDAALAHKDSARAGALPLGAARWTDIVLVRNNTDAPRARFESLGIDGLAIAEADNPEQFAAQPVLEGVEAGLAHAGVACVLLQPVEPGQIAKAAVSGVVPAMVRMRSEQQRFADVDPDRPGLLRTWHRGSAQLLWVQPPQDRADPSVALTLARLGAAAVRSIRVVVSGATAISANRWALSWIEAQWSGVRWVPVLGGVTSDDWGRAYNGIENNNSASGTQGSGVNVDNFPGTFALRPVQPGASLEIFGPEFAPDGTPSWHFDAVNAEDGECDP